MAVATIERIDAAMRSGIEQAVFPGAVLLVAHGNNILFHRAYGLAELKAHRPVSLETVFDLASLTKPLATALAAMQLAATGRLDLDANMSSLVPQLEKTDKQKITVRQLLLHTSGFPAYRPYYRELSEYPMHRRKDRLGFLLAREPIDASGVGKAVYSDLGFMVLRWVIESAARERLDRFLQKEIYEPLGLKGLFFIDLNAAERCKGSFAATETCLWRERTLCGEVHDENAWVCGGIEGHAGLFGTASAVHGLLTALMAAYRGEPEKTPFKTEWVRAFFQKDEWAGRALGFDMPDPQNSSAGRLYSKTSIGHLGFTGTSFWTDLKAGVTVVLLTNRIHPSRENQRIKAFRPLLHDLVRSWIEYDPNAKRE